MSEQRVGIGMIGAGDVSLLHAEGIRKTPSADLVGLWNRTAERADERAKEFGCSRFSTPEELVASPEVDAVFVLTNLETHLQVHATGPGSGETRSGGKTGGNDCSGDRTDEGGGRESQPNLYARAQLPIRKQRYAEPGTH